MPVLSHSKARSARQTPIAEQGRPRPPFALSHSKGRPAPPTVIPSAARNLKSMSTKAGRDFYAYILTNGVRNPAGEGNQRLE